MKQYLFLLLILCFSFQIQAQDHTKNLEDFNSLSVSADIKLELILSDDNSMEIDMVHGELKNLIIEEKRDHLSIYTKSKNNWGQNNTKAHIKLYYKELDDISVSAGARVFSDDVVKSTSFEANVSSGATLDLELVTGNFESNVSSGGSFKIAGTASSTEIDASSGGSFKGSDLKCSAGDLEASSGGFISIWVTERIEAQTSSGGTIKYRGNPSDKDIDKDKWSGGSVVAIGNR